jgi:hypothetical protein
MGVSQLTDGASQAEELGVLHLSTGQLLRDAVAAGGERLHVHRQNPAGMFGVQLLYVFGMLEMWG